MEIPVITPANCILIRKEKYQVISQKLSSGSGGAEKFSGSDRGSDQYPIELK